MMNEELEKGYGEFKENADKLGIKFSKFYKCVLGDYSIINFNKVVDRREFNLINPINYYYLLASGIEVDENLNMGNVKSYIITMG